MTEKLKNMDDILKKYAIRKIFQRKKLSETVTDKEVEAEVVNITKNRNISYEAGNINVYSSNWHLEMILNNNGERIDSPIFSRKYFKELRRTIKEDRDYLKRVNL